MTVMSRERRIKSAVRVLEVLEMFDGSRQSVTVMDVARCLDCPQSSTSELLRCLVEQGYLIRDRSTRTYRPSARVALLGAWVQPGLFRYGRLLRLMDQLNQEMGEPVVLGSMVGVALTHAHVVGHDIPPSLRTGTQHHLLRSPFGKALIATAERDYVRKLSLRLNAESPPADHVRYGDLAADLDAIETRGYAVGDIGDGMAAVTVLLPSSASQERLSLGFMARTETVRARGEDFVRCLRGALLPDAFTQPGNPGKNIPQPGRSDAIRFVIPRPTGGESAAQSQAPC